MSLHKIQSTLLALQDATKVNTKITKVFKDDELSFTYLPIMADSDSEKLLPITETIPIGSIKRTTSNLYYLELAQFQSKAISAPDEIIIREAILPEFREKLNNFLISELKEMCGMQPTNNKSIRVPSPYVEEGVINPTGYWAIERALYDCGYEIPFVIGSDPVWYFKQHAKNCYYEGNIDPAYDNGDDNIIAFDPNSLIFAPFSENAKVLADQKPEHDLYFDCFDANEIKGYLWDDTYGLIIDILCSKQENGYAVQLSLAYELFHILPNDGINGIFHFVCCKRQPITCNDTNQ